MARVLVVGDVMTDVIVRPEGPLAHGTDRRATIRSLPGGSGANQAAWLAHLGVSTRFAGRVGSSDHVWQKTLLSRHGVDARLAADDELPTGTVVTLLAPDGERSFFTERGANMRLDFGDLPDALLDGVELVHVSGYALFEPGSRDAVLRLVAKATARGLVATVDPGSEAFIHDAGATEVLNWMDGARIILPNAAEGAALTGADDPEAQLALLSGRFPLVVLKNGAKGAAAAAGERRWRVPSVPAEVVDSSGAGDAFVAGFLRGYLLGNPVDVCLAEGAAAASRAIGQFGARPPLPG